MLAAVLDEVLSYDKEYFDFRETLEWLYLHNFRPIRNMEGGRKVQINYSTNICDKEFDATLISKYLMMEKENKKFNM